MDLLREQAEFEGCLTRIKFDRLNFMGARADSIRLSIKRPRHDVARSIDTLSAQEIQRCYTKIKFDATLLRT